MNLADALRLTAHMDKVYSADAHSRGVEPLPWHLTYAVWLHEGFDPIFSVEEWSLLLRAAKSAHTELEPTLPPHDWAEWYGAFIGTYQREAHCYGYA